MRDPDKISRAKAKRNYKEMINAGWEFLAPAWRGVQDSASYPAFRYYYASMADELRSPANKSRLLAFYVKEEPVERSQEWLRGVQDSAAYPAFRYYYASFDDELYSDGNANPRLLAFYVKEEPVERSQEWLRGVKFTSMNRLDKLVNYKEGDLSHLPKQIYIVRVTGESIHLYSVFDTRLNVESPFESIEGCFCVYLFTQINPEALRPVDFSTAFIAPGAENGPSVAACEEAFAESRRLKAHKLTVDWLTYYVCHEDGGYHTEDKCDPAYVPSPPSDEKFAANRKRKGITSLPDTIYLLDHYQESQQWRRMSLGELRDQAGKRRTKRIINAGWEFLAPAWRGVQDSAAYPAFRYYYASPRSSAEPRLLAFYVKEEPVERSQEWLREAKFTSMSHLDRLMHDYAYDLRCLPKQIYIVLVTSEGIRAYPVFHTRYSDSNDWGTYYSAIRDAINPEALHPVLLNLRDYIPCVEGLPVPESVGEEALEQSRRLKRLGLDLPWITYRTRKDGGRYLTGTDFKTPTEKKE